MHTALRSLLIASLASLVLAPAAFADTETSDLYLAMDDTEASACDAPRLSYDLGSQTGACSDATFGGLLGSSEFVDFSAESALPMTLDVARPVHVTIETSFYLGDSPRGPLGDETVALRLTGKRQGSNMTLTLGNVTKTAAMAERFNSNEYTYEFDIQPTADKAGIYKSLNLSVQVGGGYFGGYVSVGGSSVASFPIIDGTAPDIEE